MEHSQDLLSISPGEFIKFLKQEQINRFYLVNDPQDGVVKSSSVKLQPIADFINRDQRDFMQHEGLFFQVTEKHDILQGAFIHRTNRGQAAGGVRFWHYAVMEDFIRDGMRLGKGMTRKNALAGLWWGGGKGVMAKNPEAGSYTPDIRSYIYREYGEFISSLRGCYVTAEDVGTHVKDMADVFSRTRFTSCIPEAWGGSGNPSVPTARGVISGMEAALDFIGDSDLSGKTVTVQGMGNVGEPLIGFLFDKNVKKVIAYDIFPRQVEKLKRKFSRHNLESKLISADDATFYSTECDIFSPNATGAVLNPDTIPRLRAKIVCGAANNQLEDAERDDKLLLDSGIVYVPDFLTNRMGIVNAADEQFGYVNNDPLFEKHLSRDWEHSVYQTALAVLQESSSTGEATAAIAMLRADELSLQNHPIFGHRGRQIIASLVEDRWHELPRQKF